MKFTSLLSPRFDVRRKIEVGDRVLIVRHQRDLPPVPNQTDFWCEPYMTRMMTSGQVYEVRDVSYRDDGKSRWSHDAALVVDGGFGDRWWFPVDCLEVV